MPLSPALADAVLRYLDVVPGPPDVPLLGRLIAAYTQQVPWESVSRIARRAAVTRTEDCPRWPEQFWREALALGTGGTCFESNLALHALLGALGYTGDLTINDMKSVRGCHTALIVHAGGGRWLVDAGFPVHAPLPLLPSGPVAAPFHTYTLVPSGAGRYDLERDRHPAPYCFTLVDSPVPEPAYRTATTADYGPDGLFLDEIIVTRVIAGVVTRFASDKAGPPVLERFLSDARIETPIEGDIPAALAAVFSMDAGVLRAAFTALAARQHGGA